MLFVQEIILPKIEDGSNVINPDEFNLNSFDSFICE